MTTGDELWWRKHSREQAAAQAISLREAATRGVSPMASVAIHRM